MMKTPVPSWNIRNYNWYNLEIFIVNATNEIILSILFIEILNCRLLFLFLRTPMRA